MDNFDDTPPRPRAAGRRRAHATNSLGISDDGFAPLLRGIYDELRYADASLLAFFTAKAAWRPMTLVYRDIEVHLARGELPASWRDLERATGLAVGTLQDIVARLKSAGKLQSRICKTPVHGAVHHGIHASVQGVTVYLVVDYPAVIDYREFRRAHPYTGPYTVPYASPYSRRRISSGKTF
jgi:hypothetical protein